MSENVEIQEVGPRDGLQNEKTVLTPDQRAQLIEMLIDSGLRRIQVGSFVNPKLVPQMGKTDEVLSILGKRKGVRMSALILNKRGLEFAIMSQVDHIEIGVSASDSHSLRNTGLTRPAALNVAREIIPIARESGIRTTATVMCAFGCEFEGPIDCGIVKSIASDLFDLDPDEISLADTTGRGTPDQVEKLLQSIMLITAPEKISLHFHDTYGNAVRNVLKALDMGIRKFDSSLGGLGGCPFIPGASGNISTEKLLDCVNLRNLFTGIDPDSLQKAVIFVRRVLSSAISTNHPGQH